MSRKRDREKRARRSVWLANKRLDPSASHRWMIAGGQICAGDAVTEIRPGIVVSLHKRLPGASP